MPSLFLQLANLHRPRREGHEAGDGDRLVIASLRGAVAQIGGDAEADLDKLSQVTSDLADAIVAGRVPLPVANINTLAQAARAFSIWSPSRLGLLSDSNGASCQPGRPPCWRRGSLLSVVWLT